VNTRVIHVASGREWRGGQRQVWLLARELERSDGLTQVVVTGGGSVLAERLRASGVSVRSANWRAGLDPRVCPVILSELRRSPAILHAHDAHALTLAGLCAGWSGAPLVATRRVDFHLRRRGFWAKADHIIAISHAVAAVLVTDGIAPARITVVHSGIPLTPPPAPLGIRSRLGLPHDVLIAANVAALVPHKDHATLLRAAKLLESSHSRLHWVISGEGPGRHPLERLRSELGLGDRVHFLGYVDEPARLIVESDVFVMSSREEGLGTSVLDAMSLGIPVASTSAGGLPEMLDDGAGLLVSPEDPPALAEAVSRILDDGGLRVRLIQQARAVVRQFSAERMAAKVRTVYRSCAQSH
jgi:glycosyltransferase involved in cell wall biosynthesis